ncbi:MAG: ComEC family competence protein [Bacteroidales bacterium]|nr:ComEC family competence protein [Bacteroidales bacterium]
MLALILNASGWLLKIYRLNQVFGIFINAFMIIAGIMFTYFKYQIPDLESYKSPKTFIGIVTEPPTIKEKTIQLKTKLIYPENITLQCLLNVEPSTDMPNPGDTLIFNASLKEITNSGNPFEFDYKKYLAEHGVFLAAYVTQSDWKIIGRFNSFHIIYLANKARTKVLGYYKKMNLNGNELAIISALTLGYKNWLTREIKEVFSRSGAIHILAVSGLHVGILFLILNFFLQFLNKYKKGYIYKSFIIITFIWVYATLAGLSPSILRASLMFTIMAAAKLLNRQTTVYHSLALSAFLILLIDPYSIKEIGFQLSYCAVAGIAFFHPKISRLIIARNPILCYLWDLITVSIAAQIFTFPFSLYYFHQFPVLFLVTNLIVIPLAFIVIIFVITGLILSFVPAISTLIFQFVALLTRYIYYALNLIQNIKFSVTENVYFNFTHLILTLLLIASICVFVTNKSFKNIIICLTGVFIFSAYLLFIDIKLNHTKKFTLYNSRETTILALYKNKKCVIISDANHKNISDNYCIKEDLLHCGIKKKAITSLTFDSIQYSNNYLFKKNLLNNSVMLVQFDTLKIGIIKDKIPSELIPSKPLKIDYLILCENPGIPITKLNNILNADVIIFDSSNKSHTTKKWINECQKTGKKYHNTKTKGAYTVVL